MSETPPTPKKNDSALVAVTLSAFLPGYGQKRQGRSRMAALMVGVLMALLLLLVFDMVSTYNTVFSEETDRILRANRPGSMEEIVGAAGTALVACFREPRIIAVLLLLPCVHVWSMADAYWAARKAEKQ